MQAWSNCLLYWKSRRALSRILQGSTQIWMENCQVEKRYFGKESRSSKRARLAEILRIWVWQANKNSKLLKKGNKFATKIRWVPGSNQRETTSWRSSSRKMAEINTTLGWTPKSSCRGKLAVCQKRDDERHHFKGDETFRVVSEGPWYSFSSQ